MLRLLTAILLFPLLVSAQELHTFSNGEVADAEKMNQNFEALANELEALSDDLTLDGLAGGYITADCSEDANALSKIIDSEPATRLNRVSISVSGGNCNFPLDVLYEGRHIDIYGVGLELIYPTDAGGIGIKNGHLYLNNFVLNGVRGFTLFQHASLHLHNVSFKSSSESSRPRISVRSNSLLRLSDSFESANSLVRPDIYVTNSELRILSQNKTAVLGNVDLAMNATFWCRWCQIDVEELRLDTNSSFCGYVDDGNGNVQELGIDSLSVQAGSVFLHEGAPPQPATYASTVSADSVAIWDDTTNVLSGRCFYR